MYTSISIQCSPEHIAGLSMGPLGHGKFKIHQRGVQWKHGVVVYIRLQAVLLCNTTPSHYTPLRLHPPLPNTQKSSTEASAA